MLQRSLISGFISKRYSQNNPVELGSQFVHGTTKSTEVSY